RHALEVRGAPGTPFVLRVGRFGPWASPGSGQAPIATDQLGYGPPEGELPFSVAARARYHVELRDLPPDPDAAPLGCVLVEGSGRSTRLVARDYPRVEGAAPVERAFNYGGTHEVIGFEVPLGRDMVVTTSGARKSQCELYRVGAG